MNKQLSHSGAINTLYYWCNDVTAMKSFYTRNLRLQETYFKCDEAVGWLTYQVGSLQLVFIRAAVELPVQKQWARTPSFASGTHESSSLVLCYDEQEHKEVIQHCIDGGARSFSPEPTEHGQFWVMDPMGMTIEIGIRR